MLEVVVIGSDVDTTCIGAAPTAAEKLFKFDYAMDTSS